MTDASSNRAANCPRCHRLVESFEQHPIIADRDDHANVCGIVLGGVICMVCMERADAIPKSVRDEDDPQSEAFSGTESREYIGHATRNRAASERQRIRHEIELMIERGDYYEPEHDVMAFDLKDILRVIGDV